MRIARIGVRGRPVAPRNAPRAIVSVWLLALVTLAHGRGLEDGGGGPPGGTAGSWRGHAAASGVMGAGAAAARPAAGAWLAWRASSSFTRRTGPSSTIRTRRWLATIDCSRAHRACSSCRNQRVPGSTTTALVCSTCQPGWRLRRLSLANTTCDCAPGMFLDPASNWCTTCPLGQWCPGGSSKAPGGAALPCPAGLATIITGAKSQAQCFTTPGYGRSPVRGENGVVGFQGTLCPVGLYNIGRNSGGCQACNPGLTTAAPGTSSPASCVAPAGSFVWRSVGKACPMGTFTADLNRALVCTPCPNGLTTASEGSSSPSACSHARPGYFLNADGSASACPVNTFSDSEGTGTSCTPCPFGLHTRDVGATGVALCLVPPGYELKEGASAITLCDVGFYNSGWNRAPCVACGTNLDTEGPGAVSRDACRVPAGYGLATLSPLSARMCVLNTYGDSSPRPASVTARCRMCPPHMVTPDTFYGQPASSGYTSESDCLVPAGMGRRAEGSVEMCRVGTYNPGGNRDDCTACPSGYTTLGEVSKALSDCVVQPGWELDTSSSPPAPRPCSRGTWSSGGTSANPGASCVPCPAGFTTQTDAATSADDCSLCTAGRGGAGCGLCPHDTFSPGDVLVNQACTPCASGFVSARGSVSSNQCYAAMVDPARDVFELSNETFWASMWPTTSAGCSDACANTPACVQYRFSPGEAPVCQVLLEDAAGSQQLGFKVAAGADFVFYSLPGDLGLGAALGDPVIGTTRDACVAACRANSDCEALSFMPASGDCQLLTSQLSADWAGMVHVAGDRLLSDMRV